MLREGTRDIEERTPSGITLVRKMPNGVSTRQATKGSEHDAPGSNGLFIPKPPELIIPEAKVSPLSIAQNRSNMPIATPTPQPHASEVAFITQIDDPDLLRKAQTKVESQETLSTSTLLSAIKKPGAFLADSIRAHVKQPSKAFDAIVQQLVVQDDSVGSIHFPINSARREEVTQTYYDTLDKEKKELLTSRPSPLERVGLEILECVSRFPQIRREYAAEVVFNPLITLLREYKEQSFYTHDLLELPDLIGKLLPTIDDFPDQQKARFAIYKALELLSLNAKQQEQLKEKIESNNDLLLYNPSKYVGEKLQRELSGNLDPDIAELLQNITYAYDADHQKKFSSYPIRMNKEDTNLTPLEEIGIKIVAMAENHVPISEQHLVLQSLSETIRQYRIQTGNTREFDSLPQLVMQVKKSLETFETNQPARFALYDILEQLTILSSKTKCITFR